MTKNKHILNDKLQLFLKDISDKIMQNTGVGIYENQNIVINAFSINNRAESKGF